MAHLTLHLFGQFRAVLDGQLITDFPSDKVRALLAYLVTEASSREAMTTVESGKAHSRTTLATLLWSGYREESARTSLRQALHHLRKALSDDEPTDESDAFLQITRQTVEFNLNASFASDVHRFSELLATCASHPHRRREECSDCLARLQDAAELYQGDFLAGFALNDSTPFEEWRRIKQEQFHIQLFGALTDLSKAAMQAGAYDDARKFVLRQLEMEPWREESHRKLMRILAMSGDRSAAIAQYRICQKELKDELGIEPDSTTTQLYEQIRSGNALTLVGKTTWRLEPQSETTNSQVDNFLEFVQSDAATNIPAPSVEMAVMPEIPASRKQVTDASSMAASKTIPTNNLPAHNLPVQLTPFVGREREVATLCACLQRTDQRLLTLVGPGGMGKTRLAQQVASRMLSDFADGVFWIGLESLADSGAIVAEIAAAVGLTLQGNQPQQQLFQYLRTKQMLLLLDNFEHLLAGSLLVAELLQATERLQVIVTSREQLNISGEQLFIVDGLSYPSAGEAEDGANATAVELFVASGQRVSPGFQWNPATLASVVRICRLLQGMPLALELAAAWLEVLPVAEIANEIENSVDFLNIDWRRTIPSRQQSMRAVFNWSWQLLNEGERQIFRRLSIFRGGFTREAAAKVCAASIRTLAGLAHKSLLRINDPQADVPRYQIHELLRQFAAEELATAAEVETVALSHSEFYLSYVAAREKQFHAESGLAVAEIQSELDNIRHGWTWAVDHQNIALQTLSLHSLAQFFLVAGFATQGVQLFRYAAQRLEDAAQWPATHAASEKERHSLLSSLYAYQAEFLVMLGQYQEAVNFAKQGSEIGQLTGNKHSEVLCKFLLAKVLGTQGEYAGAREQLQQTLVLVRNYRQNVAIEDRLVETELSTLLWLGHIASLDEQLKKAHTYFDEGLQLARSKQYRRGEVSILLNLASLQTYGMGDFANAKEHYARALKISTAIGYRWGEASALLEWGDVLRLQGEYSTALNMYKRAQSIFEQINHSLKAIYARLIMGRLYLFIGDIEHAHALLTPLAVELNALAESGSRQNVLFALATYEYHLHQEEKALDYIEEGLHRLADTLSPAIRTGFQLLAGHCYTKLNQYPAAAASYQLVLAHYPKKQISAFAAEAYAGLANLAFCQSNITTALYHVEQVLTILSVQSQVGYDEPFFVYLTCYRVLASLQDGRAKTILEQGHRCLEQYAAHIQDEGLRCSFYENVDVHRELRAAYAELTSHSPTTRPIPIP